MSIVTQSIMSSATRIIAGSVAWPKNNPGFVVPAVLRIKRRMLSAHPAEVIRSKLRSGLASIAVQSMIPCTIPITADSVVWLKSILGFAIHAVLRIMRSIHSVRPVESLKAKLPNGLVSIAEQEMVLNTIRIIAGNVVKQENIRGYAILAEPRIMRAIVFARPVELPKMKLLNGFANIAVQKMMLNAIQIIVGSVANPKSIRGSAILVALRTKQPIISVQTAEEIETVRSNKCKLFF